jgi:hypothetical protein
MTPNQTLETNRRPASPLGAGRQFVRAVHAQACLSGGGRSAFSLARMLTPLQKHRKTLVISTVSCCVISVLLFLATLVFWVRRYPDLRDHEQDGLHVIFAPDDYHGLLQVLRLLFFGLFPVLGVAMLITARTIWKIARYASETSEKTGG